MVPKFNDLFANGYAAELVCPSCGNNYLHHEQVEMFDCGEDAKHGLHVTVGGGYVTTDTSLEGNPSARRHGLKIQFECEGCEAKPTMSIYQHKGNTYFDFK